MLLHLGYGNMKVRVNETWNHRELNIKDQVHENRSLGMRVGNNIRSDSGTELVILGDEFEVIVLRVGLPVNGRAPYAKSPVGGRGREGERQGTSHMIQTCLSFRGDCICHSNSDYTSYLVSDWSAVSRLMGQWGE